MSTTRVCIIVSLFFFLIGGAVGFGRNWYASGMFPQAFRTLPKDRQITLLRDIGRRISPARLRTILHVVYPDEPADAHELAHLIGEAAYARLGNRGFSVCDSSFTFACYHGVILAAIRAHGDSPDVLEGVARGCDASSKNDIARISCAHGIGHGIMWVRNYAFVLSFQECDKLFIDAKLRFACWDGVAMENIVRRADSAKALPLVPWKKDDIYYPCSEIPLDYQPACVREQVFMVRLTVLGRDTGKSVDYCLHFTSPTTRSECFGALGGAFYQDDATRPAYPVGECKKLPGEYVSDCIGRVATNYAYAGMGNIGINVCKSIAPDRGQRGCLDNVAQASAALYMLP